MGKIRIIGGIHRSRQLPVLDSESLRPTLDRVKETLFNWLGQDLTGSICLDLFAGSGSLGFEAVSRNAKLVTMVEKSPVVVKQLKHNQQSLKCTNCEIIQQDAITFLQNKMAKYDVIFLDPPYNSDLLNQCLQSIHELLNPDGVCYIEYEQAPNLENYRLLKQGKAGKVHFALISPQLI